MTILEEFRANIQILYTDESSEQSRFFNAGLKEADRILEKICEKTKS